MTEQDFDILMAKAALGELPLEEVRARDGKAAGMIGALTQGLATPPPAPPMPAQLARQLEQIRTEALRERQGRGRFLGARHTFLLRLVAALALVAGVTWLLIPHGPPTARITLTSIAGEVSTTRPTLAWESRDKPGQKYDVWILPAEGDHIDAPLLYVAKNVESPVAFDQLKPGPAVTGKGLEPGKQYRALVCLANMGRHAGVPVTFRVSSEANPSLDR